MTRRSAAPKPTRRYGRAIRLTFFPRNIYVTVLVLSVLLDPGFVRRDRAPLFLSSCLRWLRTRLKPDPFPPLEICYEETVDQCAQTGEAESKTGRTTTETGKITCVPGRVHSAVVSGVNWEQRTVTVEWFERGETKGKEVIALRMATCLPPLRSQGPPKPTSLRNHVTFGGQFLGGDRRDTRLESRADSESENDGTTGSDEQPRGHVLQSKGTYSLVFAFPLEAERTRIKRKRRKSFNR